MDIGSLTDAMHVPVGTTAQRPGSPAAGYFRYNTTTSKFEGYTDSWGSIGGGSGTNMDTNIFAGDGSDTTFTLSNAPDTENNLMVFIDGVFQAHDSYSVSGTTLTFSTAPASSRVITVYHSTTTVGGSNNSIATMTGDGSDTTLTLSVAPVHENNVSVFFDGVYQSKSNYSISGTTLTFSTAPPNGVAVEAITATTTSITTATQLLDADSDTMIQVEESSDEDKIRFDTGGTERMIIDSTGVGIGTSSPSTNLHIYSTADNAPHLLLENYQNADTDDAAVIELYLNDQTTGGISDDTDVGVIRFTGDEKDGGTKETYAEIRGVAHDPGQGASNKGNLSFFVQAAGDLNETLTLDEAKVGINQSSPSADLHITGSGDTKIIIEDGTDEQFITAHSGGLNYGVVSGDAHTFVVDGSDKVAINANGMGIGNTAGPGGMHAAVQRLVVGDGAGNEGMTIWSGADSSGMLGFARANDSNTDAYDGNIEYDQSGRSMRFAVNAGAERGRFTSNGFLVGTTNDSVTSNTLGHTLDKDGYAAHRRNSAPSLYLNRYGSEGNIQIFYHAGTGVGSISVSDDATAFNTSSDGRLKDVTGEAKGLEVINKLNPVSFNWKNSGKSAQGMIAQEVLEVMPECVIKDEESEYYSMDYSKLVTPLIKAVQEQQEQIEELKQKIETLENA